jgi:hypothetical protein
MPTHAQAVHAAIEAMRGTLLMAAVLVRSGRNIDLAGLDLEAARLCTALGALPAEQAVALRPAMEALLRDVDRTAAALAPPDD